jgi:hypothetical protein
MQQTIPRESSELPALAGVVPAAAHPVEAGEARLHLQRLQNVIRFASLATSIIVVALPIYSGNFNVSGFEKGLLFAIPAFMMAIKLIDTVDLEGGPGTSFCSL